MSEEKWKEKLEYFKIKNQERRIYSFGELSKNIRQLHFEKQNGKCNGCNDPLPDNCTWIILFRYHAEV